MSQQAEGRTIAELAELVGGRVVGDAGTFVRRVSSIEAAGEGDLAFVEDENVRHLAAFVRGSRRGFTREEREASVSTERELLFKVSR